MSWRRLHRRSALLLLMKSRKVRPGVTRKEQCAGAGIQLEKQLFFDLCLVCTGRYRHGYWRCWPSKSILSMLWEIEESRASEVMRFAG